jgi:ABC-type nickel/cobalt efflux system permease component RcnA
VHLDGRRLDLATTASRLSFPPGSGGLPTLRLECDLTTAGRPPAGAPGRTLTLDFGNRNYADRVGWREVVAAGDGTTLSSSDVPAASASARLTSYPRDLLRSPLEQRSATVSFRPGGGAGAAGAGAAAAAGTVEPRRAAVPVAVDRATRAFTELVARRRLSPAFGALAVALALLLGAVHALAPGHGKTVMAAYLLGLRSSLSQALLVASTVTLTHTAGVLALGVALSASTALAPERIYPWLGLASGLLLASVGVTLLRRAVRAARPRHAHGHPHQHRDGRPPGWRGLMPMGFAGGLVPSPSALVVLLGAIALGRAWFGVLLVLAYGAGMAMTLTGAGLLLVHARAALDRRASAPARPGIASLSRVLPLVSAAAIIVVGLFLAAQGASGI